MPRPRALTLHWSPAARADLIRLRAFIAAHNPDAVRRAAAAIKKAADLLCEQPGIGHRIEDREDRELFVPFGRRGYLLRYRLHGSILVILRVWHSLENRA